MSIKDEKNLLRREYLAARFAIKSDEHERRSRELCARLMKTASYRLSNSLLMFAPAKGEPDIMPVARAAWGDKKTVAFPLCDTKNHTMKFLVTKSEDDLSLGAYGILEPSSELDEIAECGGMLCLIPAVVFDKKGFRIGYGKGYYDRFLSGFIGGKCGICFSDFIVESLPRGAYDTAADMIVTEGGVILTNEN